MDNSVFEVDTKLDIIDYVSMVNEIVLEFFNSDGVYQPHIGKLNAMRLFYNKCVTKSKFDVSLGHDIIDAMDMVLIVKDNNFIEKYNEAIAAGSYIQLDFGNAYKDAMEIVDVKKSSFGSAVEIVKNMIMGIVDKVSPILTPENIENVSKIAADISEGKLSAESLVDAYANHMIESKTE